MNRNRLLNKYLLLALILTALFAMTGCRTRITNNSEVSNVYYDEDGFLSETYQMRRDELGLSTAESPIFPDLGGGETEDDFDSSEETGLNYEPEEDTYVEPPTTTTTTPSTTRHYSSSGNRYSSPGSSTTTVSIYLHGEGGTIDGKNSVTMSVKKNEKTTLPGKDQATGREKIKKEGYKFKGWSKKPEDKKSIVNFEFKTSENVNLYAIWDKDNSGDNNKEITITFNPDGGKVSQKTKTIKRGEKYGELPTPTKSGNNEFKGWYTKKKGKGEHIDSTKVCNRSSDITLFAYWKSSSGGGGRNPSGGGDNPTKPDDPDPPTTTQTHKVIFYDDDGTKLSEENVEDGKAANPPSNIKKRSGYTLSWDKDFSKVTSDLTVTAKWTKKKVEEYWEDMFDEAYSNTSPVDCIISPEKSWVKKCKLNPKDTAEYVVAIVNWEKWKSGDASTVNKVDALKDKGTNVYIVSDEANDSDNTLAYQIALMKFIHESDIDPEDKASEELGVEVNIEKIKP